MIQSCVASSAAMAYSRTPAGTRLNVFGRGRLTYDFMLNIHVQVTCCSKRAAYVTQHSDRCRRDSMLTLTRFRLRTYPSHIIWIVDRSKHGCATVQNASLALTLSSLSLMTSVLMFRAGCLHLSHVQGRPFRLHSLRFSFESAISCWHQTWCSCLNSPTLSLWYVQMALLAGIIQYRLKRIQVVHARSCPVTAWLRMAVPAASARKHRHQLAQRGVPFGWRTPFRRPQNLTNQYQLARLV